MAALKHGDEAPDFDLEGPDGSRVWLSDFRGRQVVVYFYPKDNTPGCTTEAIDFSALAAQFAAADTAVIGISPDSARVHQGFCNRFALNLLLVSDPEHIAAKAYGAWGRKTLFGRKYMGFIRSTFLIGPDGRVAEAWPNVRVHDHAQTVLQAAVDLAKA